MMVCYVGGGWGGVVAFLCQIHVCFGKLAVVKTAGDLCVLCRQTLYVSVFFCIIYIIATFDPKSDLLHTFCL